jgi:hypothetical protein
LGTAGRYWPSKLRSVDQGESVSFIEKMKASEAEAAKPMDPWLLRLERVRGEIGLDKLERISTQTVLDILQVPQRKRTAGTYRHLAKVMAELGWAAVRVRDITRGGYKEQVRGYVRRGHAPRVSLRERTVGRAEKVKPQQGTTSPSLNLPTTGDDDVV